MFINSGNFKSPLFILSKMPAKVIRSEKENSNLERELYGELNLTCRKRAANCSESRAVDVGVCRLEIRSIEQIKEFGAQFQPCCLVYRQPELLMHAQIELEKAVASGDVAPGVAERLIQSRSRQTRPDEIAVRRIRTVFTVNRVADDVRTQRHAA